MALALGLAGLAGATLLLWQGVPAGRLGEHIEALRLPSEQAATVPEAPVPEIAEAGPARTAPSLDLVRVEPDGAAVIAGRAEPGDTVRVILDGVEVGRTRSGPDGSFVLLLVLTAADNARTMWLMAEGEDGQAVASADTVILAPAGPLAAATSPPSEADMPTGAASDGDGEVRTAALAGPETGDGPAGSVPEAPAGIGSEVVLASPDGLRLPDRPALADPAAVQLDGISYGADGQVHLTGRAGPGASLQVSLDGAAALNAVAGPDGHWTARLDAVPPGEYRLRVEARDAAGQVTGQAEVPFRRVDPATDLSGDAPAVTVQPGATLWAIARDRYGDGRLYVQVFEANRGQIGDPHLIYPGQVFALPEPEGPRP